MTSICAATTLNEGSMWRNRAYSLMAAARLVFNQLSPNKLLKIDDLDLSLLESLAFNDNGKLGPDADAIASPLRRYLLALPGYQAGKQQQSQITNEQHGFIVMECRRPLLELERFLVV